MKGLPALNVSRETEEALIYLADSVLKWNPTINLVSRETTKDIWIRHIVDSAQVFLPTIAKNGLWVDFGTGGGFPGLVIAVIGKQFSPGLSLKLVESDRRKCSFLKTMVRDLSLSSEVINSRVERLELDGVNYVSARAVSRLNGLLGLVENIVSRETECLFLKGGSYKKEVAEARENWDFTLSAIDSVTSAEGRLLILREVKRVGREK